VDADIIIVGAGAAGLLAARHLAHAGCDVVVLAARRRPGGRIRFVSDAAALARRSARAGRS